MIEDKLTHDERRRLECLAQSVILMAALRPSPEQLIEIATRFDLYVETGAI